MASSQVSPLPPSKGAPPLFIRASTLATPTEAHVNGLEICYDLEKVAGDGTVDCVQRMGDLFRIYPKTPSAREILLINGFYHNNLSFSLLSRNPFQVRDEQVRSTKIIIGGCQCQWQIARSKRLCSTWTWNCFQISSKRLIEMQMVSGPISKLGEGLFMLNFQN